MQNVSEYMLLLALCLVNIAIEKAYCNNMDQNVLQYHMQYVRRKVLQYLLQY